MPHQNIVGSQVKIIRLSKQPPMTQDELAINLEILGWQIDRFGISKIERGERRVIDKELHLLAKALGIGIESLFPGDASQSPFSQY